MQLVERTECRLCGRVGVLMYQGLRDMMFGSPGEWNFMRCPAESCGLVWLNPEPAADEIAALYGTYYTHDEDGVTGTSRRVFRAISAGLLSFTRVIKERQTLYRAFVDERPRGDLLEVGCGTGERLQMFVNMGWRVTGQEIDPLAGKRAAQHPGVEVYLDAIEGLAASGRQFDAIVMSHVVEHVPEPVAFLATCKKLLRDGGSLTCVTPNARSWGHRTYGRDWRGLEPPRHFVIFTPSALRKAAQQAGFDAPRIFTSCANVQVFAGGSIEIRARRRSDNGHALLIGRALASVWAQLRALAAYRADPDSGDELILRCGM